MRVRPQKPQQLICSHATFEQRAQRRFPGDRSNDEIWQSTFQAHKQSQHTNVEQRLRVSVHAKIVFQHQKPGSIVVTTGRARQMTSKPSRCHRASTSMRNSCLICPKNKKKNKKQQTTLPKLTHNDTTSLLVVVASIFRKLSLKARVQTKATALAASSVVILPLLSIAF
jgi:hypothetical protein